MVTKLKTGTKVGQLGIWDGTQWVAGDPDCNIVKWGGTALTARDITTLLDHLNVDLSTRALEAGGNLAALVTGMNTSKWGGTALTGRDISLDLAKLDVALSTRALEAGGNLAAILARLNVGLDTRAAEATAQKLTRIWSCKGAVHEYKFGTVTQTAQWINGGVVPAGEIWFLDIVGGYDAQRAPTRIVIGINQFDIMDIMGVTFAADRDICATGLGLVLVAGDYPSVYMSGLVAGDSAKITYSGYTMYTPMV